MMRGFDISNHQGAVNVADLHTDFIIAKATEGLNFVDRYCDNTIQQAKTLNVPWGFYHFARSNDPIQEADFFIANCKNYFGEGIPILDFEMLNSNNWLNLFCSHVYEQTQVYPWVYMNADYINNRGYGSDWVKEHCGLWLAGYPANYTSWRTDTVCPYAHKGWILAAWQFTSSFNYNGISLDADYAYLSREGWERYAKGDRDASKNAAAPSDNKWILARQVLEGMYGDGIKRRIALDSRYNEVQDCVNTLINGSDVKVARAVIAGELGNGDMRSYILGPRYINVQKLVNKLM